jgi:hypothetical protein
VEIEVVMKDDFAIFNTLTAKARNFFPGCDKVINQLLANSDYPCVRLPDEDSPRQPNMQEVRCWCEEMFSDNWLWNWNEFYFKNKEDAVVFALRWS